MSCVSSQPPVVFQLIAPLTVSWPAAFCMRSRAPEFMSSVPTVVAFAPTLRLVLFWSVNVPETAKPEAGTVNVWLPSSTRLGIVKVGSAVVEPLPSNVVFVTE